MHGCSGRHLRYLPQPGVGVVVVVVVVVVVICVPWVGLHVVLLVELVDGISAMS